MLTDTHCHLDLDRFDADRDEVVARAVEAGVEKILVPALDLDGCQRVLALSARYKEVFAAVGVHPNSAKTWRAGAYERLRDLAAAPEVVAIGEIGLDYYWDAAPPGLQQDVFQQQLRLAGELGKPVVVHNREASDDVVAMLLAWQRDLVKAGNPLAQRPGVMHSFSAARGHAEDAIGAGFYIGITGPITFKNAPNLQQLVSGLPLEALLVETDSPYLAPHPYRGQRNEPSRVALVAQKIGELKGLEVGAVENLTGENSAKLFGW